LGRARSLEEVGNGQADNGESRAGTVGDSAACGRRSGGAGGADGSLGSRGTGADGSAVALGRRDACARGDIAGGWVAGGGRVAGGAWAVGDCGSHTSSRYGAIAATDGVSTVRVMGDVDSREVRLTIEQTRREQRQQRRREW
jgi:hypothetical protein